MKEPKYHWQYGLLSGYPLCCIAWFYLRMYLYVYSGLIHWKVFKKINKAFARSKFRHVTCPLHSLLKLVGLYPIRYFNCSECGWEQFGDSKECAVKGGHEGWVRERIENYYSSIKPNQYFHKFTGRIAKEARQKFKVGDEE